MQVVDTAARGVIRVHAPVARRGSSGGGIGGCTRIINGALVVAATGLVARLRIDCAIIKVSRFLLPDVVAVPGLIPTVVDALQSREVPSG